MRCAFIAGEQTMRRLVLGAAFAAVLGTMLIAISHDVALAQQRATCSQARSVCGKQRICQERFQACMRTGCWSVWRVRRCGYVKQ